LEDIAGYQVLGWLGEGSMGQVYKARHLRLDRLVALKVIHPDRLASADTLRRFQREARAAARLAHPHVVSVYDAGEAGGKHYLALEYVEGTDLDRMVRARGPLPIAQACDFVRQAALGLQHAHERGLVHRDIKPANLLVTSEGSVVKLLDLGLARLGPSGGAGEQPSRLTRTGQVMGTPAYLAPEQAVDSARADIRSDIYSLGCTLYFLLTARLPFYGSSAIDVILKHQLETAPPLTARCKDIPPGLQEVVSKTLAKRPEERYQTPAELVAALEPFCRKSSAAAPEKEPPSPPLRARRRRYFPILAGGAAVALMLGSLALLMLHRPKPDVLIAQTTRKEKQVFPISDTATEKVSKAMPLNRQEAVTCNNRGFAHYEKKEYPEAIAAYTEAIRLDPQFAVAYNNRGLAHAAQREYEEAIEDYNQAIALNPEHARTYSNRGDSYSDLKQYDRAIQDYDEAIQRDSKHAITYNNRGLARAAKGDYEGAIEDYSEAIRLKPELARAYYNRGIAYAKTGNAARAEADREKAASLDPSLGK
jgi:serine/threonine protein kinase